MITIFNRREPGAGASIVKNKGDVQMNRNLHSYSYMYMYYYRRICL